MRRPSEWVRLRRGASKRSDTPAEAAPTVLTDDPGLNFSELIYPYLGRAERLRLLPARPRSEERQRRGPAQPATGVERRGWGATRRSGQREATQVERSVPSAPAPQAEASAQPGSETKWNERASRGRSDPAVERRERQALRRRLKRSGGAVFILKAPSSSLRRATAQRSHAWRSGAQQWPVESELSIAHHHVWRL